MEINLKSLRKDTKQLRIKNQYRFRANARKKFHNHLRDVRCEMWDLGCEMYDLGCEMYDLGCEMYDLGCEM
jgi:hypothetical protein